MHMRASQTLLGVSQCAHHNTNYHNEATACLCGQVFLCEYVCECVCVCALAMQVLSEMIAMQPSSLLRDVRCVHSLLGEHSSSSFPSPLLFYPLLSRTASLAPDCTSTHTEKHKRFLTQVQLN